MNNAIGFTRFSLTFHQVFTTFSPVKNNNLDLYNEKSGGNFTKLQSNTNSQCTVSNSTLYSQQLLNILSYAYLYISKIFNLMDSTHSSLNFKGLQFLFTNGLKLRVEVVSLTAKRRDPSRTNSN